MKKILLCILVGTALIFCITSSASAVMINQIRGGDRVVYDTVNDLYWYPYIDQFTGMTRDQQNQAINNLDYAGSTHWRMATATETTLQKDSLSEMATVGIIETSWMDYPGPDTTGLPRTPSSPHVAYSVPDPSDFWTPTQTWDDPDPANNPFWSGGTHAYTFNGRTTGWGWTNTGPGGFGGELEWLYASADDHFVAHGLLTGPGTFNTMTFNYDLHYREDWETMNPGMGPVGAWVVADKVPEPTTMLFLGIGLIGIAAVRRKIKN